MRKPSFDEIACKYKGRAWFYASPLARNLDNGMRKPVLGLRSVVGLILLIACTNLAGLTLVRIARRTQEIATRIALGATQWKVLSHLWLENSVLALVVPRLGWLWLMASSDRCQASCPRTCSRWAVWRSESNQVLRATPRGEPLEALSAG